jgi:hypothetical protein
MLTTNRCSFPLKAQVFDSLAHNLRAGQRIAEGRKESPSAAIFDSRTMPSTPESGGRVGYDGAKHRKGNKVHLAFIILMLKNVA